MSDIGIKCVIDFYLPEFNRKKDNFKFADLKFRINENEIPLRFNEISWDIKEGEKKHLIIDFKASAVDRISCAAAYDEAGFRVDDIDLKLLANATELIEFPLMCTCQAIGEKHMLPPQVVNRDGVFEVKELVLSDGEDSLKVSEKILFDYSEAVKMDAAMVRELMRMLHS